MLAAEPTHAQSQDLVVTDHGIDPATAGSGFVLQPANQVDDRDAVRATVEVVAQEGQPGLTPTPRTVRVEQFRLPERGDVSFAAPVHVADYIVHLPNLGTVRVIRCQTLSLIHISEPTRQAEISYAVFCLKKKKE